MGRRLPAGAARYQAFFPGKGFLSGQAFPSDQEFLSDHAFRGNVKQPVELVIGALKALDVQTIGPDLPASTRRMGQDLLNPPDVSGWKGGDNWISATTLLERFNFADRLAAVSGADQPYFIDVAGQLQSQNLRTGSEIVDHYLDLLVDGAATPEARQALIAFLGGDDPSNEQNVRGMLHLAMSLPTHQLA